MGKQRNGYLGRHQSDPVSMTDLMGWVQAIEDEQNKLVQLVMHPASINPGEAWTLAVVCMEPKLGTERIVFDEARMRWPSSTHKTVLGAFLYLLMVMEQRLAAAKALDNLSSLPRQA